MTTLHRMVWLKEEQVKPVQAGAEDVDVAAEDVSVASLRPKIVDRSGVTGSGPSPTLTPLTLVGGCRGTEELVILSRCLDLRHAFHPA